MRAIALKGLTAAVVLTALFGSAAAQTREKGPWWPHPIWGAGDQAGASNWITPAKILESIQLVKQGKVFELGQVYESAMPIFGQRSYSMSIAGTPGFGPVGSNRIIGNEEFLATQIGQVGTQFDGLGHIGRRMRMGDGSEKDVYYNGFTGDQVYGGYGLQNLGVEHVKPFITRGILIDVAAYKGVGRLANGYQVTAADVRGALSRQGMSERDIRDGDALLFRYGWSQLWSDPPRYNENPPGIGMEVARWVVERKASLIGGDQWGTEVTPNPDPTLAFPVHQELMMKNGIFNLENMKLEELSEAKAYEFLFIFTPVPFKGATGSPGRPLAIR